MRTPRHPVLATIAAAFALLIPAHAGAQALSDNVSPALFGANTAAMTQAQPSGGGGGGIGVGVKGGYLYSTINDAEQSFDNNNGWEFGLFFGGNRTGVVGVMAELLYSKKAFKTDQANLDLYYLQIPVLLRINIGSGNKNKGVIVYAIGGPAFDVNLQSKLNDVDVKDQYEDLDIGILAGGGIEISRVLFEARYNWGLKDLLKNNLGTTSSAKSRTLALLAGVRFN